MIGPMGKAHQRKIVAAPQGNAWARWPLLVAVLLGLTFVVMTQLTWGHWPDVLIDFGRELYTPWRITQGQVLYRDIAAFYGPLSAYLNAALFAVFGTSLQTLVIWNLMIAALMTWLVYRLMADISGRLAATAGGLMFLLVFAFGQYVNTGNYNFVTPYSHEAMHGCVLAFACLVCVGVFLRKPQARWAAIAGFLAGLTFLTKPEAFLSLAAALLCASVLMLMCGAERRSALVRALPMALGAFVVPIVIAFGLLMTAMPAREAMLGVLGSWPFLLDRQLTSLPFFQSGMGFDDPSARSTEVLIGLAAYLTVVGPAGLFAMLAPRSQAVRWVFAAVIGTASAASVWMAWSDVESWAFSRPLPVIVVIAGVGALAGFVRGRKDAARSAKAILQVAFCALAMVYLLKMILNVRLIHYGFILALPATLVMIACLADWLPRLIDRAGGAGVVLRSAVLSALAVVAYKHVKLADDIRDGQTYSIGSNGDQFWTDFRAMDQLVGGTLKWISENTRPDQTVAVIPEGVMINYLTRRASTIPMLTMLPPDLIMFGEQTALDSLKAHPPDYIILVHRHTGEYGANFMGRDYGKSIIQWVEANYQPAALFGHPPLNPNSVFGLGIMKRK